MAYSLNGELTLFNPLSASKYKMVKGEVGHLNDTSQVNGITFRGFYLSATAVNAFQFFMTSGNITSGTIYVYGYAK